MKPRAITVMNNGKPATVLSLDAQLSILQQIPISPVEFKKAVEIVLQVFYYNHRSQLGELAAAVENGIEDEEKLPDYLRETIMRDAGNIYTVLQSIATQVMEAFGKPITLPDEILNPPQGSTH